MFKQFSDGCRPRTMLRVIFVLALGLTSKAVLANDILTATPVTYMLAQELVKGTGIGTAYLPPKRYSVARLPNWFETRGEKAVVAAAGRAQVAITLSAVWPKDPLFVHARQSNIRLVEIDASQAISPRATGVAAIQLEDGSISPYIWLNPANLSRMAMIVSDDLQKVWPQHAQLIGENRQALIQDVRSLINRQQTALQQAEIDSVLLMSSDLEDFAAGHQLFVVERLTKQELDWTEEDKQIVRQLLAEDPSIWILTSRKVNANLAELLGEHSKVLVVDNIDRWGSKGIKADNALSRWDIKITP